MMQRKANLILKHPELIAVIDPPTAPVELVDPGVKQNKVPACKCAAVLLPYACRGDKLPVTRGMHCVDGADARRLCGADYQLVPADLRDIPGLEAVVLVWVGLRTLYNPHQQRMR